MNTINFLFFIVHVLRPPLVLITWVNSSVGLRCILHFSSSSLMSWLGLYWSWNIKTSPRKIHHQAGFKQWTSWSAMLMWRLLHYSNPPPMIISCYICSIFFAAKIIALLNNHLNQSTFFSFFFILNYFSAISKNSQKGLAIVGIW